MILNNFQKIFKKIFENFSKFFSVITEKNEKKNSTFFYVSDDSEKLSKNFFFGYNWFFFKIFNFLNVSGNFKTFLILKESS